MLSLSCMPMIQWPACIRLRASGCHAESDRGRGGGETRVAGDASLIGLWRVRDWLARPHSGRPRDWPLARGEGPAITATTATTSCSTLPPIHSPLAALSHPLAHSTVESPPSLRPSNLSPPTQGAARRTCTTSSLHRHALTHAQRPCQTSHQPYLHSCCNVYFATHDNTVPSSTNNPIPC
jgi:hypothetical protein